MQFTNDIEKHSGRKGVHIDAYGKGLLSQRIVDELMKRSFSGLFIVPMFLVVGLFAGGYSQLGRTGSCVVVAAVTACVFIRGYGRYCIKAQKVELLAIYLKVYFTGCVGMSLLWGLVFAATIIRPVVDYNLLLMFVLSAGLTVGSFASFSIWKALAATYVIGLLGPASVVGLLWGSSSLLPVLMGMVSFLFFILAQVRYWNSHFFDSLLSSYLFEKQAGELERANALLRETIAKEKKMQQDLLQVRKHLSESRGHFQAVLTNMELPVYCKDTEGRYLTTNRSFEKICGLTGEQIYGKKDSLLFDGLLGKFLSFLDGEVVRSGEPIELEGDIEIDGRERSLVLHKFALYDDLGNIHGTAGICTDMSNMKEALHAAQLANETKRDFLSHLSHELKGPMHSVMSFARLGLKKTGTAAPEKISRFFQMIIESGDKLLVLLEDLLRLSSLETANLYYHFQPYDLSGVVREVISEYEALLLEHGIRFGFAGPEEQALVHVDKNKILQVLRNLLSNAIKFSPADSVVSILVSKDTILKDNRHQAAWRLTVSDEGVGLAREELELVFNKFYQGQRRDSGGVGLGLAISREIVNAHRGQIWADHNIPGGASFSFVLPAKNDDAF